MARVGELLVALGWITEEQCLQALQAQLLWGARVGTNLVELGLIDLDQLSKVLGRQHGMPAALGPHFDHADRELQWMMPTDIAERYAVVPLSRIDGKIVIATTAPLDEGAAMIVAMALRAQPTEVAFAIAAELRIRYQLERVYQIPRDTRFLRVRGPTPATPPRFEIIPVDVSEPELALPPPDDLAVPRVPTRPTRPEFPRRTTAPITAVDEPRTKPPRPGTAPPDEPHLALGSTTTRRMRESSSPPTARTTTPRPLAAGSSTGRGTRDAVAPPRTTTPRPGSSPPIKQERARTVTRPTAPPITTPRAMSRMAMPALGSGNIRLPAGTLPPTDQDAVADLEEQVADASQQRAPTRPGFLQTLADEEHTPVGRIPLKRVAIGSDPQLPLSLGTNPPPLSATLGEATRAIRRSGNGDTVAQLVVQTVAQFMPATEAAMLLLVRDSVAVGRAAFSRTSEAIAEVAIPLDEPGLIAWVVERNTVARCPTDCLGALDFVLVSALGVNDGQLVACPIAVGDQVIGVIALVTDDPLLDWTVTGRPAMAERVAAINLTDSITAAAGAAFARLMRDASR